MLQIYGKNGTVWQIAYAKWSTQNPKVPVWIRKGFLEGLKNLKTLPLCEWRALLPSYLVAKKPVDLSGAHLHAC